MDRGMISDDALEFLGAPGRRYLLATRRQALMPFQAELRCPGRQHLPDNPDVDVEMLQRHDAHDLLAWSSRVATRNGPCAAANGAAWPRP
jgi:hypothetical protein